MKQKNRIYTKEFKQEAAKLVIEQGYKATEAARNLEVNVSNVNRWVKEYKQYKEGAFPGKGQMQPEQAELRRLREENKHLKIEREILKKATVFFAKECQ